MEPPRTEQDWFCFPCGHGICKGCNDEMVARRFLACPTCRTPRENVSQQQVELANRARVDADAALPDDVPSVGRYGATIFFPDESGGANPFAPLAQFVGTPLPAASMPEGGGGGGGGGGDDDEALELARVLQAQEMVGEHLPLTQTTAARTAVTGPMRELVDRLLTPVPILEFLAQREIVRRHRPG